MQCSSAKATLVFLFQNIYIFICPQTNKLIKFPKVYHQWHPGPEKFCRRRPNFLFASINDIEMREGERSLEEKNIYIWTDKRCFFIQRDIDYGKWFLHLQGLYVYIEYIYIYSDCTLSTLLDVGWLWSSKESCSDAGSIFCNLEKNMLGNFFP